MEKEQDLRGVDSLHFKDTATWHLRVLDNDVLASQRFKLLDRPLHKLAAISGKPNSSWNSLKIKGEKY